LFTARRRLAGVNLFLEIDALRQSGPAVRAARKSAAEPPRRGPRQRFSAGLACAAAAK